MQHEWIVEVLDDLSSYARENELEQLETALDLVRRAAIADVLGVPLPSLHVPAPVAPRVVKLHRSTDGH